MVTVRLWHRLVGIELVVEADIQMVRLKRDDRFEGIGVGGEPAIGFVDVIAKVDDCVNRAWIIRRRCATCPLGSPRAGLRGSCRYRPRQTLNPPD